jgi:sulfane dehydrogenase subunit SoxC
VDVDPEGIGPDELSLAARNHGMPLEALRYDRTPAGLHYLLVHYDIPDVDAATFRLSVQGLVERPLSLSLEDLRSRPVLSTPVTLECAGNGRALYEPRPVSQPWLLEAVGTAEWTGISLGGLLAEAGIQEGAVDVAFAGLDHGLEGGVEQDYERGLPVSEATRPDLILAYEMNGQPLPPQHGYPLRLVVPGWYGMASVKWLSRIEVLDHAFDGYQNTRAYRWKATEDEAGTPLERILVRSIMVPPGFPTFLPRSRNLPAGLVTLQGRAWSGMAPIERVEVSVDGGDSWEDAALEPAPGPHAWHRWTFLWDATPGEHVLASRATDATGATQPPRSEWNVGGYTNNAVQLIPVTVSGPADAAVRTQR